MLAIISDLHLTDGTTCGTVSPGAFQLFAERLEHLAWRASHRQDGSFRPLAHLDVLLLGDVLDVTHSSRWLADGAPRPWDDPRRGEFVQTVTNITSDILRHNAESLEILRGLSQRGAISVPLRDGPGGANHDAPVSTPVAVRLHYMVGNHDWYFHLPGGDYDVLRRALIEQIGLAHADQRPFAHDAEEHAALQEIMRRHRVLARHGDIYDPLSYEGDRDASSLSDAIVIELIGRFVAEINRDLAEDLPTGVIRGLRDIGDVRPLLLVPLWLDGLLDQTRVAAAARHKMTTIWDRLVDRFLEIPFVRARDRWSSAEVVDSLARILKFSKQGAVPWSASDDDWLEKLASRGRLSFAHRALAEHDFRNRRAKHVVYGHTHLAEQVPLDASSADAFVLEQMYFNTGAWRRVFRPTYLNPNGREFLPADTMTMLVLYQGDERKGRPYETWSGTLGPCRQRVPVHRIDVVGTEDAGSQSISTPSLRTRPPHFAPSLAPPGIVPTRRV